jgi:ATP-binding cassette subfamily B multidrug efflux pump
VQLFRGEGRAFRRFEDINRRHRDTNIDAIFFYAVFYPAVEVIGALAAALIILFGGRWTLQGTLTLGSLVAFLLYSGRFFRPISDMSEKFNVLQAAMASSERIFKLLDTPIKIESATRGSRLAIGDSRLGSGDSRLAAGDSRLGTGEPRLATGESRPGIGGSKSSGSSPEPDLRTGHASVIGPLEPRAASPEPRVFEGHIIFDHVWFAYNAADSRSQDEGAATDFVLRDVSFEVRPGERVGIVGATGAGKSTLINLLLRFYDVTRGRILVDGVDVRDMNLQDLRRLFSLVLQDVHLFSGTIAENIRLGNAAITDDAIARAAEAVHANQFIARLPGGYGSPVAERGATLSVGQKQLLSFARALAFNPRILVLDEATSSVDTETELLIRDALNVLMAGRTTIAIAHRLSTIQDMDQILVLHKGQVREAGRHQELLAQRGIYYKLYQLQYRDQEDSASDEASRQAVSAPPL